MVDVDDARPKKSEQHSGRPKKLHKAGQGKNESITRKVGAEDNNATKEHGGSTIDTSGVQNTGQVESGARSEPSISQLGSFEDTVSLELPAIYEQGNVLIEDVHAKWLQIAHLPH